MPPLDFPPESAQAGRIHHYTDLLALRRGIRLSLLLEAWKLRHGSLPKSLDELIGPDLDHVPIDPFTGMRFRFVRDGVGIPMPWRLYDVNLSAGGEIDAHVPFVWSAGPRVSYSALQDRPGDLSLDRYYITDNIWYENQRGAPRLATTNSGKPGCRSPCRDRKPRPPTLYCESTMLGGRTQGRRNKSPWRLAEAAWLA